MRAFERIFFVAGGLAFGALGLVHFIRTVGVPTDPSDPSLSELGLVLAILGAAHVALGIVDSRDRRGIRLACRAVNGVDASVPIVLLGFVIPPALASAGALLVLNVLIGHRLAEDSA